MPADDLVLNVRQIAGYTPTDTAPTTASILMQLAGLGSAYASISPADLVGSALASGGAMTIGGPLTVQSINAGSGAFSNLNAGLLTAQRACVVDLMAVTGSLNGVPLATQADVAATVTVFNGRTGDVRLWRDDILCAGGALLFSPRFEGEPRAPTPLPTSNSSRIATTAFVTQAVITALYNFTQNTPLVFTFNGRSGNVVLTEQDVLAAGGGTVFDSVALTGIPTAPTAPIGTNTTQLATCAFVQTAIADNTIFAPLVSPSFIGQPTAPTPPAGNATGQLATTAFVMNAVTESTTGVSSFNTRTGAVVLDGEDILTAGGALLASPSFTGVPQAPTAAPGTSNIQIATTAFVMDALGAGGGIVASFNGRSGTVTLLPADITSSGGALIASPTFTGTPAGPTAVPGTSTGQLATTAFVMAAINGSVASFNGRTGAVTLGANDISAAGGLINPSAALTGVPTAPTASPGANNTQIATTAYVQQALLAGGGVVSFNGRAGAITLTSADISGAGGALGTTPLPSAATPLMDGTAAVGVDPGFSRGDHVHPTDTSRYAASNPSGFQTAAQVAAAVAPALLKSGGIMTGTLNAVNTTVTGAFTQSSGISSLTLIVSPPGVGNGVFNNANSMNYAPNTGLVCENTVNPALSVNKVGGNGTTQLFLQGAVSCGSISVANANSTQFNTTSDGRLKEDRQPIKSGELIDAIEVWDFLWKPTTVAGRRVNNVRGQGVIAQDVVGIFPDAIHHDEATDSWGADYSKFVPMLLNEVKALRARVAALEAT